MSVAAVCLGAKIIEKHFTIDRSMGGPEQKFSYRTDELKKLIQEIRYVEKAMGNFEKSPSPEELKKRDRSRRCLVANTAIEKGQIITEAMIGMKRPLAKPGLNTAYFERIVGKVAIKGINKNSPIYANCIKR